MAPEPRSNLKLTAYELDELWNNLACDDAVRRFRAMANLTFGAGQAVPFLDKRLAPAKGNPMPAEITQLFKDLDDRAYAVRDKARRELEKRGKAVESYLRLELAKGPSLEVERSLTLLLAKLGPASVEPLPLEKQRELLAVRILELNCVVAGHFPNQVVERPLLPFLL